MEATHFPGGERTRLAFRVDSRLEKGLVDVNVPEPADQPLIEKYRLDLSRASPQPLLKPGRGETTFEWLLAQPLIQTVEIITKDVDDPAEFALVRKAQIETIVELDRKPLEAKRRLFMRHRAQSPGHTQVDDDRRAIVEINDQVLGAPPDAMDNPASDPCANVFNALVPQDSGKISETQ